MNAGQIALVALNSAIKPGYPSSVAPEKLVPIPGFAATARPA